MTFPEWNVSGISIGLTLRVPGVDVAADRDAAMARLDGSIRGAITAHAGDRLLATARQVHGNRVSVATAHPPATLPEADAVITTEPMVAPAIAVADCAPVWLATADGLAWGAVHSGRKGTELGVAPSAVAALRVLAASRRPPGAPDSPVHALIGPCIRPPHYETDFASAIRTQLEAAGVAHVHDCGFDTFSDPERFYSYRRESGRTGRMLAVIWKS